MSKILLVGIQTDDLPRLQHSLAQIPSDLLLADSYLAALECLADPSIDLVLSEVSFSGNSDDRNGLDLCRYLRSRPLSVLLPFLFWSSDLELETRIQGYNLGADGYLGPQLLPLEIQITLEFHLQRNQKVQQILHSFGQKTAPPPLMSIPTQEPTSSLAELPLTPAEQKVFKEVAQGLTNQEIGDHLNISPRTVQTHITNMLRKLQLDNRAQIVRLAFEGGYMSPD